MADPVDGLEYVAWSICWSEENDEIRRVTGSTSIADYSCALAAVFSIALFRGWNQPGDILDGFAEALERERERERERESVLVLPPIIV